MEMAESLASLPIPVSFWLLHDVSVQNVVIMLIARAEGIPFFLSANAEMILFASAFRDC